MAEASLNDLEHLLAVRSFRAIDGAAVDDILAAALRRLRTAQADAVRARAHHADLRPALRRLVREYAEVHGRTAAQQVQAFTAERHEVFLDLALRAWGLDLEA